MLGRVESADAFLDSARVVPLISRGGTGVQLKTIEALQAGRASVATPSSLRGMDGLPDNCRRADTADAFAAALISLVEQDKLGKLPKADGHSFLRKQRQSMNAGLALGAAALA